MKHWKPRAGYPSRDLDDIARAILQLARQEPTAPISLSADEPILPTLLDRLSRSNFYWPRSNGRAAIDTGDGRH
jgi:hypothetical protein